MKILNTKTNSPLSTKGLHSATPHFRTHHQLLTHLKKIQENLHELPELKNNTLMYSIILDEYGMGYYDKDNNVNVKVQNMLPSALAYTDLLKYVEKLETYSQAKFKSKVNLHKLFNVLKLTLSILIDNCTSRCKLELVDKTLLEALNIDDVIDSFSMEDYYSGEKRITNYIRMKPLKDAAGFVYSTPYFISTQYGENHYLNFLTEFRLPSRNDVGYLTPTVESIKETVWKLLKQEGLHND